jgi:hypothetical protein
MDKSAASFCRQVQGMFFSCYEVKIKTNQLPVSASSRQLKLLGGFSALN